MTSCETRARDGRLRVLAVHRYYWPDTPPYATLLRSLAEGWAAAGHHVTVVTGATSYKPGVDIGPRPHRERAGGVRVLRLPLLREENRGARMGNLMLFSVLVALRVLLGRADVVMTSTSPPVLLAWMTSAAARLRGAAFVYHCMDVHPEIGRLSGDFAHPVVYRALLAADRATCRRATRVVVLSGDMASALAQRPRAGSVCTVTIPNIDLPTLGGQPTPALLPPRRPGVHRVVFTGNVGRFQALDRVLDGWRRLRPGQWELVVMGEGSALEGLRRRVRDEEIEGVVFVPHADVATARHLASGADLCLVSLLPGVEQLAYPSKTVTYLAEGCPVLAVVEPSSELARTVTDGLGVVVPVDDPGALGRTLDDLHDRPEELAALRDSARVKGAALVDADAVTAAWLALLDEVAEERG